MESFGVFIKAEREKRGIRLEEIASITKIHLHTLEMLEEGDWEKLPPEPFIRGFITAYGKYVGLDTQDLIQRYAEEVGEQRQEPDNLTPPQDVPQTHSSPGQIIENSGPFPVRKMLSGLGMVGIIGLLFTIVYLGKQASQAPKEGGNQVASVAPDDGTAQTTTTAENTETSPAATETPPTAVAKSVLPKPSERQTSASNSSASNSGAFSHKLVVKGQESSWVKVFIDNNSPMESFLKEGETVTYEARQKIKVTLGNSTGASVTHNGKTVSGKQFLGTIRTYEFPKGASFPKERNPSSPTSLRRD